MPKLIKNILVPTDFSQESYHAFEAAIKFAKKVSGQIFLYHRIHLPPNWKNFTLDEKREHPHIMEEIAELQRQFQVFMSHHSSKGIKISPIYSSGDLIYNVEKLTEKFEIDFVIMSSDGAMGLDEFFIGSNAQKVSQQIPVPVLVVKHKIEDSFFKQVVFASDFEEDALPPFKELVKLLQNFGSNIHLVHIASLKDFVLPEESLKKMQKFEEACWALPCFIHGFADQNVELGIQHFTAQHKTDLVCVVNHQRSKLSKLFKGSISEKLINHLEGPVLSLPAPEKEPELH